MRVAHTFADTGSVYIVLAYYYTWVPGHAATDRYAEMWFGFISASFVLFCHDFIWKYNILLYVKSLLGFTPFS